MARQIILDTETTGLDPAAGHRIIEIGCVELINRRLTGNHYHQYLNPDREIDAGAIQVHGITNEKVQSSPRFSDIVTEFMTFIENAELIIHNAPFDVGFINHELQLLPQDWQLLTHYCKVLDTLPLARKKHPGQKNSLDALCKRYGVDNSQRELHGALLDAEILADVYLAMTGGQVSLLINREETVETAKATQVKTQHDVVQRIDSHRAPLPIIEPTQAELAAHQQRLEGIDKSSGGQCIWKLLPPSNDA